MEPLNTLQEFTSLTPLNHDLFDEKEIQVWMKRDDLNHPTIQGNKLHKLKYNLAAAKQQGKESLLTFGGAYSNHIAATAAAGKSFGFKTIGFIRGDELENQPDKWSPTLKEAHNNGMQLHFLNRMDYRQKTRAHFLQQLQQQFPDSYILPEGGTNELALQGFEELSQQLAMQCPDWTHLYCAVGTGGTLAGLVKFSASFTDQPRHLLGVATLKQASYLIPTIEQLCGIHHNQKGVTQWQLLQDYCGQGYGKENTDIHTARIWFEDLFEIPLDPVYTNKMIYGFLEELAADKIPPGAKVILYHSGGLQGRLPEMQT
ncbi:pyridoxal-phosphate dependent enzyme [Hydrogenovibrio sp. 3SP14C1]|uniref:1-aminocyclopropane-1-carboxylate deaminase/D-cysteine desulfhydrase n=1 Tax=Hydrogenovibrio sp. 3SP14C1 TaxID=3038774 RepID=UPI002417BA0F|nr:pyridoxal-phosphate dependent enzyme [Hydrogenovibrio sp. 3SP14C1]MDG4812409.1 pyridoxal-phosphate dependent enzyme [Hydrogenovibrio sp. 3SP14C1]